MLNKKNNVGIKPNTSQRNSAFELLRIIAMILIVFHHFAVHGRFEWDTQSLSIPYFWYNFIAMGGKIGSNVFVLISGYFMVNSKNSIFNFKKVLKFLGQIFFYSIAIYCIFVLAGVSKFGIISFVKTIFPITFGSWWFASAYFVLFLIHPFLNKLLHCLEKKSYQCLLVLLIICWCIIPTFTTSPYESNSLLWFITLYTIAGYIRIYGLNLRFTSKQYFALCGVFSVLTYLSNVLFSFLGTKWNIFAAHTRYFYGEQKLPVLLISLTLFMAFASIKMSYHKSINIIASATFGVYLIHDNEVVRHFLWLNVFKNVQYQNSLMFIPYSIGVVILVYTACTVIDLIRQQILEKPYMKIVNRYADSWLKPFKRICDYFNRKIFGE